MNWELVGGPKEKKPGKCLFCFFFFGVHVCACRCVRVCVPQHMLTGHRTTWVKFSSSSLSSVAALHSRQSGLQASSTLCLCSPPCHSSTGLETCYPGRLHTCIEYFYSLSHLPSLRVIFLQHPVLGVTIHCNKVKARFN